MKAAIYARCSTKIQSPEMQLADLRTYAANRGIEVTREYIDHGVSGSKESRPELNQLMKAAKRREFDAVLVWRFDRMARSVRHLVSALEEFEHLGIAFISHQESLDTSSPMGRAMFAVMAALSQLERDVIRERVAAGVRRAREKRATWGRPPMKIDISDIPAHFTLRQAQEITGISRETIRRRRLKAAAAQSAQVNTEGNSLDGR